MHLVGLYTSFQHFIISRLKSVYVVIVSQGLRIWCRQHVQPDVHSVLLLCVWLVTTALVVLMIFKYICDGLWMGPFIVDPDVIKSTRSIQFCGIYIFVQNVTVIRLDTHVLFNSKPSWCHWTHFRLSVLYSKENAIVVIATISNCFCCCWCNRA